MKGDDLLVTFSTYNTMSLAFLHMVKPLFRLWQWQSLDLPGQTN